MSCESRVPDQFQGPTNNNDVIHREFVGVGARSCRNTISAKRGYWFHLSYITVHRPAIPYPSLLQLHIRIAMRQSLKPYHRFRNMLG